MKYSVNQTSDDQWKSIYWENDPIDRENVPTLAEMVEAAEKEFPGVPFDQLQITASGHDAETIELTFQNFD